MVKAWAIILVCGVISAIMIIVAAALSAKGSIVLSFSEWLLLTETIVFSGTLIGLLFQLNMQSRDIREATKTRQITAIFEVFNSFSTDESRNDRSYVYNRLPKAKEGVSLGDYDYKIANRLWTSLDHLGLLVEKGLIEEDLLMEEYCETILRCWIKLEDHVKMERIKRGGRYQKYFEILARRARSYHEKHYPGEEIRFYEEEHGGFLFVK